MTGLRVPTGCLDRIICVRVDVSGRVAELVLETMRRSPAEVGDNAFIPTAEAVRLQIQFAPLLLEQVRRSVEGALARPADAA